jgi:hypothetical protein
MHVKTFFLKVFFVVWKYNMIYLFFDFRDLTICMKTKTCVYIYIYMFQRKSGILIPDLYFYGIKIQTNIEQNG